MHAYNCPKCGNSSADNEKGITLCYLEWRLIPVKGQTSEAIAVDYENNEGSDVDRDDKLTSSIINSTKPDLEHYHCNACSYTWTDSRPHSD